MSEGHANLVSVSDSDHELGEQGSVARVGGFTWLTEFGAYRVSKLIGLRGFIRYRIGIGLAGFGVLDFVKVQVPASQSLHDENGYLLVRRKTQKQQQQRHTQLK